MTDALDLRADVEAAREAGLSGDPLARASAHGLTSIYNRIAAAADRISETSTAMVSINAGKPALSGKELAGLVESMARAVASLALEINDPQATRSLTQADYLRAPIYVTSLTDGPLVIAAQPDAFLAPGVTVPRLGEQSLARLVNLLPESAGDHGLAERILTARMPAARAIDAVASSARRLNGLRLQLSGSAVGPPAAAVLEREAAEMIGDLLRDTREQVHREFVQGRLDGMRFKRREFFLEVGDDRDLHGLIDEPVLGLVERFLNQSVVAEVERVSRITAAGGHPRPLYRLIGLQPQAEPLTFGASV